MTRTTETLSRKDFFVCCPEELHDQLRQELAQWAGGDTCEWIECSVDSLGRIDSESSPRPSTEQV